MKIRRPQGDISFGNSRNSRADLGRPVHIFVGDETNCNSRVGVSPSTPAIPHPRRYKFPYFSATAASNNVITSIYFKCHRWYWFGPFDFPISIRATECVRFRCFRWWMWPSVIVFDTSFLKWPPMTGISTN